MEGKVVDVDSFSTVPVYFMQKCLLKVEHYYLKYKNMFL